jgi:hypothetical protein
MKKLIALVLLLAPLAGWSATWTNCASDGGTCTFTGTRNVRYGTASQYVTRKATGSIACSITGFGVDPASGKTKACSYSSVVTGLSGGGCGTGPANPSCIGTLPVRAGTVTAQSGQTYSGGHYTSTTGPCFVIGGGVTNVTIRDNEIGPCGSSQTTSLNTEGVQLTGAGAGNTILRNVIHDVSTGVFAQANSTNPIIIDRNFFYNIRGPLWQGQMVQFNGVKGGSSGSKITCNTVDDRYGGDPGVTSVEDHISMYGGTAGISVGVPIEIAYNKIRGIVHNNAHESGSGMQLGDSSTGAAGYYWVHDNTVVQTNGTGISISGGSNILIENNKVTNNGLCGSNGNQYDATNCSNTSWPFTVKNYSSSTCGNHTIQNNQGQSKLWAYDHNGSAGNDVYSNGSCAGPVLITGNDFTTVLDPVATFAVTYSQCN